MACASSRGWQSWLNVTAAMYESVYDLARRVPSCARTSWSLLAQIGALNSLGEKTHRRDALCRPNAQAVSPAPYFTC